MRALMMGLILAGGLVVTAGQAHAAAIYECESAGALCVMMPAGDTSLPAKTRVPQGSGNGSLSGATTAGGALGFGGERALLSARELSGDASTVEADFSMDTAVGDRVFAPAVAPEPLAIEEAQKILSQLKMLEVFLKSGPAADGDLTVLATKAR